jgi:hypothetical protein
MAVRTARGRGDGRRVVVTVHRERAAHPKGDSADTADTAYFYLQPIQGDGPAENDPVKVAGKL